ncbi:hypothetical protein Tco_1207570, partial [Tanacetum coccineum]
MTQDGKIMGKFKSSLIELYRHMRLDLVPTFDPFPTGEEGEVSNDSILDVASRNESHIK